MMIEKLADSNWKLFIIASKSGKRKTALGCCFNSAVAILCMLEQHKGEINYACII